MTVEGYNCQEALKVAIIKKKSQLKIVVTKKFWRLLLSRSFHNWRLLMSRSFEGCCSQVAFIVEGCCCQKALKVVVKKLSQLKVVIVKNCVVFKCHYFFYMYVHYASSICNITWFSFKFLQQHSWCSCSSDFSLYLYYVVSFNNVVLGVVGIVFSLFSLNDLQFSHDKVSKHLLIKFFSLGCHAITKVFGFLFRSWKRNRKLYGRFLGIW